MKNWLYTISIITLFSGCLESHADKNYQNYLRYNYSCVSITEGKGHYFDGSGSGSMWEVTIEGCRGLLAPENIIAETDSLDNIAHLLFHNTQNSGFDRYSIEILSGYPGVRQVRVGYEWDNDSLVRVRLTKSGF